MEYNLKDCEVIGDLVEALMAFCHLSTDLSTKGTPLLQFVSPTVAQTVWSYIEQGVRRYSSYYQSDPDWLFNFCPTHFETAGDVAEVRLDKPRHPDPLERFRRAAQVLEYALVGKPLLYLLRW